MATTRGRTRVRRIGRQEAEELLSGAPAAADRDALVCLLELAAAPAQPAELVGREAAVRAFTGAYRESGATLARQRRRISTQARQHRRVSLLSRAIAVKAFAGLLMLLLLGGIAAAATTGNLPPPVQHGAHDLLSPLGVAVPDGSASRPASDSGGTGHPSPTPSPTSSPGPAVGPPAGPAMFGLCRAWQTDRAWQAAQKGNPGRTMDPVAVRTLAAAAGGMEKIPAYCAAVLASEHPAGPSLPSHKPSKQSPPPRKTTTSPIPSHRTSVLSRPVMDQQTRALG